MARNKPGLGRGLEALLSTPRAAQAVAGSGPLAGGESLKLVPVEQIRRGKYQPRMHIRSETLQELADSIKTQGLVQPVVVRPVAGGYELVAGERRWRAAQMAGLHEVPAVVRDIPDQAAAAMSLIENIQRENLNPIEEAGALERLIREFGLTHQAVADSVGRSRAAVSNLLRLLELPDEVKAMLDDGRLEMGHGRALLGLESPALRIEAAHRVEKKGLSVRETEQLVKSLNAPHKKTMPAGKSPDVVRLEKDLSDRIGARVTIDCDRKGRGRLIVEYHSLDELDGILARIK